MSFILFWLWKTKNLIEKAETVDKVAYFEDTVCNVSIQLIYQKI
jgi:hypothetical protein